MKNEILVLCLDEMDWGLISEAAELANSSDHCVHLLTAFEETSKQAYDYGADQVDILLCGERFADDFFIASWLKKKIMKEWKPNIILSPATIRMRAVMPILAGMLDSGLTADCTDFIMQKNGNLIQIRPALGNSLIAQIQTTKGIQMATARPGIFRSRKWAKPVRVIKKYELFGTPAVRQIDFTMFKTTSALCQADIIFAGGMGIGSKEGFQVLEEAARKVGASVGASRMAVDAGFAPYSCQIGQTGIVVHPRIYVAVGISGAVHHLAGMSSSEKVIAINNDAKAPIFDYADYGIVGNWTEVIKMLVDKFKNNIASE